MTPPLRRPLLSPLVLAALLGCGSGGDSRPATTSAPVASSDARATSTASATSPSATASIVATPSASSAPSATPTSVAIVAPPASAFANEPPRYLPDNPGCAVPPGMPAWRWDTLQRVEGLDVDAVVLTIDGGGRLPNLEKELDILKEKGVHATIFLYAGEVVKAKDGQDIVRRILAEGHELANHTLTHRDLTKLEEGEVVHELDAVEEFVERATGTSTKPYFRAPFLATNDTVDRIVRGKCYRPIWISVDSKDDRPTSKSDEIVRAILGDPGKPRALERGSILLLHGSQPENLTAMPRIIDGLRERGIALLTLSDALRLAKPVARAKR